MHVLKHLVRLCREELGFDGEHGRETRAGKELDYAGLLHATDGESLDVFTDELGHLILSEVASDEVGEEHRQEVLKLPADHLGHLHHKLPAVLARALLVAADLATV